MLKTDPRKRERKKTGRYRARKGWTYVRRWKKAIYRFGNYKYNFLVKYYNKLELHI